MFQCAGTAIGILCHLVILLVVMMIQMQIRIRRFVLKIQVLHLLVTCCHLLLVQALLLIRIMTPCHIRMTKTTNQHSRWMPRCLKKATMNSRVMTTMKEVNVRQFEGDYQLA
jgi:hypothetical protein